MKTKSLLTLSAAASFALLAGACSSDDSSNSQSPESSEISSSSEALCDTCTVPAVCDTCTTTGDTTVAADTTPEAVITLPTGLGLLLDDFEDGTNYSEGADNYWYTYSDSSNGGASKIVTPLDEAGDIMPGFVNNGTKRALQVNYTLDKGDYEYDPYVGWGVQIAEDDANAHLGGITYWYKGGAHEVHIETSDVKDYDVHLASVKASRVWKQVTVRFKDMAQGGWGDEVEFVAAHIKAVSFQAKGSGTKVTTDSLFIDNIYLQDTSEVAKDKADMTINDPVYPTDTIGDITITNPLQEKAMKYLNKGLSITNWLEEDTKFDSTFKFDEADVKLMAANGIKELRFPIDLDKYLTNRDSIVAGSETEYLFDDEKLFTVLDSFVKWTGDAGMAFDIDYHEYDNSYDATSAKDPKYVTMMANVWKHVAAHYASNAREDLFFELLNEPDMTNGKVTSATWHAAAQEIVDSIRTVDKVHTLIFGDAEWYSITKLAASKPLNDDNVIYAVHTYDPFEFTHQGASWADTKTIKGLMFPYDKEKWSEYSADFGVSTSTPTWVKTNVKNYYKRGSKEFILDVVLPAKKWAVTNNVPVIINEFGAYRVKSDDQSVLNYIAALRDISDTLEIPLTYWGYTGGFALFDDAETGLLEGIKDAYGL